MIYGLLLNPQVIQCNSSGTMSSLFVFISYLLRFNTAILQTSHQVYEEAIGVFFHGPIFGLRREDRQGLDLTSIGNFLALDFSLLQVTPGTLFDISSLSMAFRFPGFRSHGNGVRINVGLKPLSASLMTPRSLQRVNLSWDYCKHLSWKDACNHLGFLETLPSDWIFEVDRVVHQGNGTCLPRQEVVAYLEHQVGVNAKLSPNQLTFINTDTAISRRTTSKASIQAPNRGRINKSTHVKHAFHLGPACKRELMCLCYV